MRTTTRQVEGARTDPAWWETKSYYGSEPSPNPKVREWFERTLPKRRDWSAIEIGACPGGNLLTLACSHGYRPVALDFLPAVQGLPAVFRKHGVEGLEVIQGDFLSLPEDRRFNVVMSFGFIEHFDDAEAVLRKHWALVEDDGWLIITLPIFGPMQLALLRLVLTPAKLAEQLQGHNTSIMDMRRFRQWAGRLPGAEIVQCGYSGCMGTWLFSSDPGVRKDRRWILWAWKMAGVIPRMLRLSCRLFSPHGVLVLHRRSDAAGSRPGGPGPSVKETPARAGEGGGPA